jgi:two-component system, NarL family, nitrate/nitrite response regulator NarL
LALEPNAHYRIVIADDDPIVRDVLRGLVESQPQMSIVAVAEDGKKAIEAVHTHKPDILLLDLLMPNLPGLETLRELVDKATNTRTIVVTSSVTTRQIVESLQLGARGIMLKNSLTYLPQCIQAVANGHYWVENTARSNLIQLLQELQAESGAEAKQNTFGLTARELDVVRLVAEGLPNKDIAARLTITEETVKRHLTNIFDKVGMSNRVELALFAINHHLVGR